MWILKARAVADDVEVPLANLESEVLDVQGTWEPI